VRLQLVLAEPELLLASGWEEVLAGKRFSLQERCVACRENLGAAAAGADE
jgi:hypothetical protein